MKDSIHNMSAIGTSMVCLLINFNNYISFLAWKLCSECHYRREFNIGQIGAFWRRDCDLKSNVWLGFILFPLFYVFIVKNTDFSVCLYVHVYQNVFFR